MSAKIMQLPSHKPKTFTAAEEVIEHLSVKIMEDGRTYSKIAADLKISPSTVGNLARRRTNWPRPRTFFAVLNHYGIKLRLDG